MEIFLIIEKVFFGKVKKQNPYLVRSLSPAIYKFIKEEIVWQRRQWLIATEFTRQKRIRKIPLQAEASKERNEWPKAVCVCV